MLLELEGKKQISPSALPESVCLDLLNLEVGAEREITVLVLRHFISQKDIVATRASFFNQTNLKSLRILIYLLTVTMSEIRRGGLVLANVKKNKSKIAFVIKWSGEAMNALVSTFIFITIYLVNIGFLR